MVDYTMYRLMLSPLFTPRGIPPLCTSDISLFLLCPSDIPSFMYIFFNYIRSMYLLGEYDRRFVVHFVHVCTTFRILFLGVLSIGKESEVSPVFPASYKMQFVLCL